MHFTYLSNFVAADDVNTCSRAMVYKKKSAANQEKTYLSGGTGRFQPNHIGLYQLLKKLYLSHIKEEIQICCHIHLQRMTTHQNFLWRKEKILDSRYWANNFQPLCNYVFKIRICKAQRFLHWVNSKHPSYLLNFFLFFLMLFYISTCDDLLHKTWSF